MPPYLRLILPSACWNASKMICCLSGEIPIPVSLTENASTLAARFSSSLSAPHPPLNRLDRQRHLSALGELEGVGEQVLDDLLQALGIGQHRARQVLVDPRS